MPDCCPTEGAAYYSASFSPTVREKPPPPTLITYQRIAWASDWSSPVIPARLPLSINHRPLCRPSRSQIANG